MTIALARRVPTFICVNLRSSAVGLSFFVSIRVHSCPFAVKVLHSQPVRRSFRTAAPAGTESRPLGVFDLPDDPGAVVVIDSTDVREAQLARAALQQARAQPDVIGLRLYVENANQQAHSTYRALGMTPAGYSVYEELWVERLQRRNDDVAAE